MASTQFPANISDAETLQEKKTRLNASSSFAAHMSPDRASEYLLAVHDIRRAPATLLKLRWKGGGPVFRKIGKLQVLYSQEDLDDWAAKMLSKPLDSTADFKSPTAGR